MKHTNIHRRWADWSEAQTLHLAVAYSNPFRFETRRKLMNDFRFHMAGMPNVVLHIAELAYGDRPHEVTGDASLPFAEFDVQLRTRDELFHKENILNRAILTFPPGWQYGGYSDADLIFTRYDFAIEAIHQLQHHPWVQLFSSYADLSHDHEPFGMARSFAYNYHHPDRFLAARSKWAEANPKLDPRSLTTKARATSATVASSGPLDMLAKPQAGQLDLRGRSDLKAGVFPFGFEPGAPGGAWAFTKAGLNACGGLLDVNILGGGDSEMAHALIGVVDDLMQRRLHPNEQPRAGIDGTIGHASAVLHWQAAARWVDKYGGIGYVKQHVNHHFHGSKTSRRYFTRWGILRKHDYNPFTDLTRDWQGIWQLAGNKPRFRDDIRRYFIERREDDPNLYGTEKLLL
jgi:hypothetical protein